MCVCTCVCVRDGDKMSVLASILDLIEESSKEVSSAQQVVQHLHMATVEHISTGRYWVTESDYLDTIKPVIVAAFIFVLVTVNNTFVAAQLKM